MYRHHGRAMHRSLKKIAYFSGEKKRNLKRSKKKKRKKKEEKRWNEIQIR